MRYRGRLLHSLSFAVVTLIALPWAQAVLLRQLINLDDSLFVECGIALDRTLDRADGIRCQLCVILRLDAQLCRCVGMPISSRSASWSGCLARVRSGCRKSISTPNTRFASCAKRGTSYCISCSAMRGTARTDRHRVQSHRGTRTAHARAYAPGTALAAAAGVIVM